LFGPRHGGFKLVFLLIAAILVFLVFSTGDYRISANTRLEGQVQRAVTAPFPGYVRDAGHRAGDTVKAGELLARLDDRDLRTERVRLLAQRDQYGKQHREAMAQRDRAQISIISSQIDQADAQLAMVDEQLARTDIVAPFDGMIVSGDLTQLLGTPLERGQLLYEVAPLDSYRVVLDVDERDIADVSVGQSGELVLSSMPGQGYDFTVGKITPVNVAREGRNYFRLEARLADSAAERLRPGMEGVGKIFIAERRLIWIWTREMMNWFRLKLWAWMP
jgi:RND family efflux transporter MFP subunit